MQSGISASSTLRTAFAKLLNDHNQRGLLVTIDASSTPESLTPLSPLPASSFPSALESLAPHLLPTQALYILLRTDTALIPITYIPDAAPVRQKMLFASSRLALVRELGSEHFGGALFVTTPAELSVQGWAAHEKHGALPAPLTQSERDAEGLREVEAQESVGTGARREIGGAGHMKVPVGDEALQMLKVMGKEGGLVQLAIEIESERLVLAERSALSECSPVQIGGLISATKPRYSFYAHAPGGEVLFIYTCPPGASIKERMMYASWRMAAIQIAENGAGLSIKHKIEASGPDEVTAEVVMDELSLGSKSETPTDGTTPKPGFAKPKRPGRR